MIVHLDAPGVVGRRACLAQRHRASDITTKVEDVTCGRCQRSALYRRALDHFLATTAVRIPTGMISQIHRDGDQLYIRIRKGLNGLIPVTSQALAEMMP